MLNLLYVTVVLFLEVLWWWMKIRNQPEIEKKLANSNILVWSTFFLINMRAYKCNCTQIFIRESKNSRAVKIMSRYESAGD